MAQGIIGDRLSSHTDDLLDEPLTGDMISERDVPLAGFDLGKVKKIALRKGRRRIDQKMDMRGEPPHQRYRNNKHDEPFDNMSGQGRLWHHLQRLSFCAN